MKIRRADAALHEQRFLDGDTRALRALVRQARGKVTLDRTFRDMEIKAAPNGTGGTRLLFTGYASTYDDPYTMQDWAGDYTEIVNAGAATKTLTDGATDVIFCLNHDWQSVPLARTGRGGVAGTLVFPDPADPDGILCEASLDGARADVYQLQSAMDDRVLGAMSFAFWVVRQSWSPDYLQRNIIEVDMDGGDVSVVTWPANPGTWDTVGLRNDEKEALQRSNLRPLLIARAEKRVGKSLSSATTEVLQNVLDLIAEADIAVDAAQPLLAELLGVPNPDTDGETPAADDTETEAVSSPMSPDLVRQRQKLQALNAR